MLTLQFVPYHEIESLSSEQRIGKLIHIVKNGKIAVMEGKLLPKEEATLIERTMEEISSKFKGIEICIIYPEQKNVQFMKRVKRELAKVLLGTMGGLTIVGPASIIKEIKKDPNKIELLTKDVKKGKSFTQLKNRGKK